MIPQKIAEETDFLLFRLKHARADLHAARAALEADIARAQEHHGSRISKAVDYEAEVEKDLLDHLKKNRLEIFGVSGVDVKVNMDHGSVTRSVSSRVKRVRKFAEKLLELGRHELLGQAPPPPVKWDLVEELDDAELKKLGTERVTEEIYKFELAQGVTPGPEGPKPLQPGDAADGN